MAPLTPRDHGREVGFTAVGTDVATETVKLTEDEAALLAQRLAVLQLADAGEWLLWENLPMLSEGSFEAISGWVEVVAKRLLRDLHDRERAAGIDTAAILERAM